MSGRRHGRGVVLAWLREVVGAVLADTTPDRPPHAAIVAVAAVRVTYASPDGTACYPSQATLATEAGLKRDTVRAVDGWLVARGLMVAVRTRARGLREYRLTLPAHMPTVRADCPDPQMTPMGVNWPDPQMTPIGVNCPVSDDPSDDPPDDPHGGHNLLPPKEEEEEETPDGAAGAAPGPAHDSSTVRRAVALLAEQADQLLDMNVVGPAMARCLAVTRWPESVAAHVGAIACRNAKSNPSAYVAEALERVASGRSQPTLPVWADTAIAIAEHEAALRRMDGIDADAADKAADRLEAEVYGDHEGDWPDEITYLRAKAPGRLPEVARWARSRAAEIHIQADCREMVARADRGRLRLIMDQAATVGVRIHAGDGDTHGLELARAVLAAITHGTDDDIRSTLSGITGVPADHDTPLGALIGRLTLAQIRSWHTTTTATTHPTTPVRP